MHTSTERWMTGEREAHAQYEQARTISADDQEDYDGDTEF